MSVLSNNKGFGERGFTKGLVPFGSISASSSVAGSDKVSVTT